MKITPEHHPGNLALSRYNRHARPRTRQKKHRPRSGRNRSRQKSGRTHRTLTGRLLEFRISTPGALAKMLVMFTPGSRVIRASTCGRAAVSYTRPALGVSRQNTKRQKPHLGTGTKCLSLLCTVGIGAADTYDMEGTVLSALACLWTELKGGVF